MIDFDSLYGPCRGCARPMASRTACQEDPTYVRRGTANGYCDGCHKHNKRGRPKDYDRPRVQGWIELAACARPGVNPEIFFPEAGAVASRVEAARFVCAGCPVFDQCTFDTKSTGERHGVRAGTTAFQRSARAAKRAA